ncbi:hypothetical protein ABNX05_04745 [Lysinibacillus sp. M3]|uniref:RiboL-PSP-HEPN domain-containing protein n=1 Tax=Lysinibacillus zambalensis TaxID=3160866 RepID=A0ABV1MN25_9BACI
MISRKSLSEFLINFSLDSYKTYLEKIPSYIKSEKEKLEEYIKIEVEGMSPEEAELHYEYNFEDEMHLFENYHHTFNESFYITLFSFLEKELYKICRNLERKNTHKIKVKHLAGNGIDKYSLFLSSLYDIEISHFSSWNEIKKHQKIRNYIVHNDGGSITSSDNIFQIANSLGCVSEVGIRLDTDLYEINIFEATCSQLINCIQEFFNELFAKATECEVII